jgi:hypothetical protein
VTVGSVIPWFKAGKSPLILESKLRQLLRIGSLFEFGICFKLRSIHWEINWFFTKPLDGVLSNVFDIVSAFFSPRQKRLPQENRGSYWEQTDGSDGWVFLIPWKTSLLLVSGQRVKLLLCYSSSNGETWHHHCGSYPLWCPDSSQMLLWWFINQPNDLTMIYHNHSTLHDLKLSRYPDYRVLQDGVEQKP